MQKKRKRANRLMLDIGRNIRDLLIVIIDWFHKPFSRIISEETFRYAATGGGNTVLDIFLYWFFYNVVLHKQILDLGIVSVSPHIAAFLIVFPITFTSGFLLAKYITFSESVLRGRKQLLRYALSVAGAICLNYIFLKLFVDLLQMPALLAKIIITAIVATYSYLLQRYFTFQTGSLKK
ncbi:MAG: GtrA family protein [Cyclobacteriaceae bacterium]